MLRKLIVLALSILAVLAMALPASASTAVPGHQGRDGYVNGHYTSLYAKDASGKYYWDLGDGRVQGADSIDDLDAETLTVCDYNIKYRADFGGDDFMDDGWINQTIKCDGPDGKSTTGYIIVSDEDPRYTGNPERATWGTWEYHVMTMSGSGNVANPMHPDYYFAS